MPSPVHFADGPGFATPGEEVHPALHPSITNVPVTPAFVATPEQIDQPERHPQRNSNCYFAARGHDVPLNSPTKFASGAKTPAELLRRLSLVDDDRPTTPEVDPKALHPGLGLSGGLISAAFCIPHSLGFESGKDWVSKASSISYFDR